MVSPSGFAIQRGRGWGNRNPVQRVAHGHFVGVPGGTRIVVRFPLDPSVILLTLPVPGVVLALWLRDASLNVVPALPAEAALFAALFVAAVYGLGCWLARDDEAFLLAFLQETLQATELSVEQVHLLDTSSAR